MIRLNSNKLINNLVIILLISTFFDAYCLFYISSYPVTIFTIIAIILIIVCVVCNAVKHQWKISKQECLATIFIVYTFVNYVIFSLSNLNAFLQVVFFYITFMSSKRLIKLKEFDSYISIFHRGMDLLSAYGIYQFFGRLLGLPFTDMIISNHMVAGYNWSNTTPLLGMTVYRSNAIFREPSFFAQFLAINILFYIVALFKGQRDRRSVMLIALNGIALLTTLSGTGFIVLGVGLLIYVFFKFRDRRFLARSIGYFVGIILVFVIVIGFTPIGNYLTSRITELFVYEKDAAAGYVRFRAWTSLLQGEWSKHWLVGVGIGGAKPLVEKWSTVYYALSLNGFAKIVIELGIIGIVLWVLFILSFFWCQAKKRSDYALMIVCILLPYMICHDTFSSNVYWVFLILLNCDINTQ